MKGYLEDLFLFREMTTSKWVILFLILLILNIPVILNDHGNTNAYVLLADSLLHKKLNLPSIGYVYFNKIDYADLINFNGKFYLPYPPFPSIIIIPLVYIFGTKYINSVFICILLTYINIIFLRKILIKQGINTKYHPWMIHSFFLGTGYWYVLCSSHHVYGFAQIIAETCLLIAINELFGKSRAIIIGTFIGCAFLSRQLTIFNSIFIIGYYIEKLRSNQISHQQFYQKLYKYSITLLIFIGIYMEYNYLRFDNPFETGYKYIQFIGILKERVDKYGIFSIHYFLYNLYQLTIKGFNIQFYGREMLQIKDMDLFGTSIINASPFIIIAFFARRFRIINYSAWTSILLITIIMLFYHNNGYKQVNCYRFTLDFLPVLFILIGYGIQNVAKVIYKSTIIYAIMLNTLALSIHFLFHTSLK